VSFVHDLTMAMTEFFSELKELQITYNSLILEVQVILNSTRTRPSTPAAPSRPTSPTTIFHTRRRSRSNATTMPRSTASVQLSNQLREIESKYAITWECAELLIELGGGPAVAGASPPSISKVPSHASLPTNRFPSHNSAPTDLHGSRRNRERAITLAGDEPKPPVPNTDSSKATPPVPKVSQSNPNSNWRSSTGKRDLSHRQLVLLREMMLNHADPNRNGLVDIPVPIETLQIPEGIVNRQWRWGDDPLGSTITLPSDSSSPPDKSPAKKRRTSRLGMNAVRDMLRSLKRSVSEQSSVNGAPPSSESSVGISENGQTRKRAKTSTGPELVRDRESPFPSFNNNPRSPYGTSASTTVHKSPRRPSLASIFRFSKNKSSANSAASGGQSVADFRSTPPASSSGGGSGHVTTDEEDWDRVDDSTSDLDFHSPRFPPPSEGLATLRGKSINSKGKEQSPYMTYQDGLPAEPATPRRGPEASRSSIWEGTWSRGTKLSNVEEIAENLTPAKSKKKITQVFGMSPNPSLKRRDHERPPSRSKRLSGIPPPPPLVQWGGKSASVRSAPPQWLEYTLGTGQGALPDPKLAMTPENIKPLLENAREVHLRCTECIGEMRLLLSLGEAGRT
jgi:hypothetical protein